jgi:hypothetical protein
VKGTVERLGPAIGRVFAGCLSDLLSIATKHVPGGCPLPQVVEFVIRHARKCLSELGKALGSLFVGTLVSFGLSSCGPTGFAALACFGQQLPR